MMKYLLIGLLTFCMLRVVSAESILVKDPSVFNQGYKEFAIITGYSNDLTNRVDVNITHLNFRFAKTIFSGIWKIGGGITTGALQIGGEPFISLVSRLEDPNKDGLVEAGLIFPDFTYNFYINEYLVPYLQLSTGTMYTDFTGFDMGGHFQFVSRAGAGIKLFLNKNNKALTTGWEFRHISNAGFWNRNLGLNSLIYKLGFSYFWR